MKQPAWLIAIPPDGAARQTGIETVAAFESVVGRDKCKSFDCKTYQSAFTGLLKNPDETMVVDLLNQSLVVQCLDFEASHLLVLALSPVTLFTLNLLRKQGVKTALWFYEDFRRAGYWRDVCSGYDFLFAIQRGPVEIQCSAYTTHFSYLPTAVGSVIAGSGPVSSDVKTVDVAFVGIPSDYRIEVLEFLLRNDVSLAIAGSGWDRYTGPLKNAIVSGIWFDEARSNRLLKTALIGLNLSVNSPDADRANTHVSPRVFDVLASGCVLVTENIPLVNESLAGLHFHTFGDKENMLATVRKILMNYDSEKVFFETNRGDILKNHSYKNRVAEIIARCR